MSENIIAASWRIREISKDKVVGMADFPGVEFSGLFKGSQVIGKPTAVDPMMAFMLVWFVQGILSYIFWKKKKRLDTQVRPP